MGETGEIILDQTTIRRISIPRVSCARSMEGLLWKLRGNGVVIVVHLPLEIPPGVSGQEVIQVDHIVVFFIILYRARTQVR